MLIRRFPPLSRRSFLAASAGAALAACSGGGTSAPEEAAGAYEPNWESLRKHPLPDWYDDAKLGIFIHWGLYSVPAWATPVGELGKVDWNQWFANNPYAEWYLNTLRVDGSPTQKHHRETYGADFDYYDFAPMFNEAVQSWDPAAMAGVFKNVGARYVVLTTKHHDGFTLWPSDVDNPHLPEDRRSCSRDIVGDLTSAVKAAGMNMGFYYSGGLDWSFNPEPINTVDEVRGTILHTDEFARYADAHWRELVKNYDPLILWNDIGYPEQSDIAQIVADFYNRHPDGVINNRFEIGKEGAPARHHDFVTPEYTKMDEITDYKWETCRGLGYSFGYNAVETAEHTIGEAELIHLLVDIVSKNGNLLLNVGPKPDGSIPELQLARLESLGKWLDANGEAIFETRPWERATGQTTDGTEVRFTRTDDAVYAVLLGDPKGAEIQLEVGAAGDGAQVALLGSDAPVESSFSDGLLTVKLGQAPPAAAAHALRLRKG